MAQWKSAIVKQKGSLKKKDNGRKRAQNKGRIEKKRISLIFNKVSVLGQEIQFRPSEKKGRHKKCSLKLKKEGQKKGAKKKRPFLALIFLKFIKYHVYTYNSL